MHTYLSERGDVETHSEGDEPDRRLVVSPVLSVSRETLAGASRRVTRLGAAAAGQIARILEALAAEPDPHTTVATLKPRSRSTSRTA